MLEIRDLHAYYGKSHILQGVDLTVGDGEIVSLLGRNGVGRSTTCKAIMGLVSPQGSITFKGRAIAGLKPDGMARAMAAAAVAQLAAVGVALAMGGFGVRELVFTALFALPWLGSAALFGRAAQQQALRATR